MAKGGPVWTGEIREVDELLLMPLKWKRPRRIFVNSMSDLFHEGVHGDFIDAILDTIQRCNHLALGHVFQVLTKRGERMYRLMRHYQPIANLWLGVSVEDQASADERIPLLLQTPAAVRWISAEPLLGAVDVRRYLGAQLRAPYPFLVPVTDPAPRGLDWLVAGGESGPGARPMHPDWARSLRDQCAAAGVPFFFKQWGAWRPATCADDRHGITRQWLSSRMGPQNGADVHPLWMALTGKKLAGRDLDGRTHDEYPA